MTTITFIVRTAAGHPMHTFDAPERALKFARDNRDDFPGLYVETEEVITKTRRLWTDRKLGLAA